MSSEQQVVHVLWDYGSVGAPLLVKKTRFLLHIVDFVFLKVGQLNSFEIVGSGHQILPPGLPNAEFESWLKDLNITISPDGDVNIQFMNSLLKSTIASQTDSSLLGRRHTLLVITTQDRYLPSLQLLQQQHIFQEMILLSPASSSSSLRGCFDHVVEWNQFWASCPLEKRVKVEKVSKEEKQPITSNSNPKATTHSICREQFETVIQNCKIDHLIPRESVIRSKLEALYPHILWSKDRFQSWIQILTSQNICDVHGVNTQRIIWPKARFPCVDFLQPKERLNKEEIIEVMAFLFSPKMETPFKVGRHGFAKILHKEGPKFLQALPFGYVVELVQLLMNNKFLFFRKSLVGLCPDAGSRWKEIVKNIDRIPHHNILSSCDPVDMVERRYAEEKIAVRYHFEAWGEQNGPQWRCIMTFDQPHPNEARKQIQTHLHAQKATAKNEACNWALRDKPKIRGLCRADDPVLHLDRLLADVHQGHVHYVIQSSKGVFHVNLTLRLYPRANAPSPKLEALTSDVQKYVAKSKAAEKILDSLSRMRATLKELFSPVVD